MFTEFFFMLRSRGLKISMNEWMTLMEALEKGLHQNSLTCFYQLCRAVLIKSEADFDRFDQVFLEFFKDIPYDGEIPSEVMDWLNKPFDNFLQDLERMRQIGFPEEDISELLKRLEERLKEQDSEHNGGNKWVGTRGTSPFGHSGWHPNGIRIGGESHYRTAMTVAGERRYRDFRKDNTLDTRQFQLAFRTLRQLTVQNDSEKTELDLDRTISDTCDHAGTLHIHYKKARKNAVKVLLLIDSGGSMDYYASLVSMLFQAAVKSNHFKELHTYYFHNAIYQNLYEEPELFYAKSVPTEWVLKNFDSSYKVIIVGDAAMNPTELMRPHYNWSTGNYTEAGIENFETFRKQYPYIAWLNPEPAPTYSSFWTSTREVLSKVFPMYQLTAEGVEDAMKKLMSR